jgi:hypothetical protein
MSTTQYLPRFRLQSLFLLTAICAWCTWQWTISQQRRAIVKKLHDQGYFTYYDSTRAESMIPSWLANVDSQMEIGEPIGENVLGSITGWDNWRGVTVFVSPLTLSSQNYFRAEAIDALSRLPRLTTIVLWDGSPQLENQPEVVEFKKSLHERLPHIKVRHVHLQMPVGSIDATPSRAGPRLALLATGPSKSRSPS